MQESVAMRPTKWTSVISFGLFRGCLGSFKPSALFVADTRSDVFHSLYNYTFNEKETRQ